VGKTWIRAFVRVLCQLRHGVRLMSDVNDRVSYRGGLFDDRRPMQLLLMLLRRVVVLKLLLLLLLKGHRPTTWCALMMTSKRQFATWSVPIPVLDRRRWSWWEPHRWPAWSTWMPAAPQLLLPHRTLLAWSYARQASDAWGRSIFARRRRRSWHRRQSCSCLFAGVSVVLFHRVDLVGRQNADRIHSSRRQWYYVSCSCGFVWSIMLAAVIY
jgi:hypothetical protein